ncbi:MAG TPA: hypothetical protein VGF59_11575 [Bryobacteraceae bacterium]|jgi:hypothetical protein
MLDKDDIRQDAILRLLRSRIRIPCNDTELYRGRNYGVATYHATIDAHRRRKRDQKRLSAAKVAPDAERYSAEHRIRLRGLNSDDPAGSAALAKGLQCSKKQCSACRAVTVT